ncbi:MAG TPA: hypothetical protein VGC13_15235 [Longimicrobium sp.]|jgi:hypothetical protein|uniref:hypothetical protein n=1 Tax=Longimicrobium sp. TaxID=2029185 RepID=UPI002EDAF70F
MSSFQARRAGPPDPVRQHLSDVRKALLRLHKALIDSERAVYEARNGPLNNAEFLGALLQEPFFQWMRPFSQLVATMDEAMFGDEPVTADGARGYVRQAHALVTAPADGDGGGPETVRYGQVRDRDPAVLFAHTELLRRVAAALTAYGGPAA